MKDLNSRAREDMQATPSSYSRKPLQADRRRRQASTPSPTVQEAVASSKPLDVEPAVPATPIDGPSKGLDGFSGAVEQVKWQSVQLWP